MTSSGAWLKSWNTSSYDFVPPLTLITGVNPNGYAFVANGTVLSVQMTTQTANYVCERTGDIFIL